MISEPQIQRIAVLSVHTSPLARLGQKKTGGMNVYVRDLSHELARRGVRVDIFTRAVGDDLPRIQYDMGCGCRVIQIEAGPRRTIANDAIVNYLDEFAAGVTDFAREYSMHYDLIHSHYWLSGLVAGKLQAAWGPTPVVHMYHTLGHMKNQIAQNGSQYVASVRLLGEAQVAHIADRLIAATPAEKSQLIEWYGATPDKITVLSPGVDLARFQPLSQAAARRQLGIGLEERVVLFVGRIEALKGIDALLRAAALLQQQPDIAKNLRVMIIGGNPAAPDEELAELLRLRDALNLTGRVDFLGARDQAELPAYYAAADVLAMPSHYESFGMVALEAMSMGTPVVASRVGGLAHLVKDGLSGYLTPPQNPAALANRLQGLLRDDTLRVRLSTQAGEYARQYDWANIADQMLDTYAGVSRQAYVLA